MNGANLSLPEPIELVALDPARNIRRRYSITAGSVAKIGGSQR